MVPSYLHGIGEAVVENVGGIDDGEGTFVAVFGERQLLQAGTEGFGDDRGIHRGCREWFYNAR